MKAKISAFIQNGIWVVLESLSRNVLDIADLIKVTNIHRGDNDIILSPGAHGRFNLVDTYEFVRKNNMGIVQVSLV